eukprot:scpid50213/ scgid15786/ 
MSAAADRRRTPCQHRSLKYDVLEWLDEIAGTCNPGWLKTFSNRRLEAMVTESVAIESSLTESHTGEQARRARRCTHWWPVSLSSLSYLHQSITQSFCKQANHHRDGRLRYCAQPLVVVLPLCKRTHQRAASILSLAI